MRRAVAVSVFFLAVCLVAPGTSAADSVLTGTAGQTFYKIVVPDAWNGDLIFWNHGFSFSPVGPVSDLGPLASLQLAEGYAVAAASYRLSGWAVFKTSDDLQALYNVFVDRFGTPRQVFVTGASLGGIVTATALEQAQLGNVVGGLTLCGVVGGSRNWDGALDTRLVYDAVCANVPGASIPGGAQGLPAGSTLTDTGLAQAVNSCFGVLAPPAFRTPDQIARLATFNSVMKLPENFVVTVMGFATFGLSDLVHDPQKLKDRIGAGNIGVVYGEPTIDATIERVAPQPGAANRLHENYTPTGNVGNTKIVSMHTDKDGLVIVENEHEYASRVPASNLTTAIVIEATPTHCGLTPAEVVSAWESLRGWVTGAPQPTAAGIQGLCSAVAPTFGGPCRVDPTFVIPSMDGRIRPRD